MNVTPQLREHLEKNHGLKPGSSDKEVKQLAYSLLPSGKLKAAEVKALNGKERLANPDMNPAATDNLPDAKALFGSSVGQDPNVRVKPIKERFNCTKATSVFGKSALSRNSKLESPGGRGDREPGMDAYYWEVDPGTDIAVKKRISEPSEFEIAKIGAVFKHSLIRRHGTEACHTALSKWKFRWTEEDQQLLDAAIHEDEWVGPGVTNQDSGDVSPRKLTDFQRKSFSEGGAKGYQPGMQKAPLADASGDASGGDQAVPQYFDFEAIRTPLLYGELVPYVEITATNRGRAAHSYSIGTPTFVTTASGSAISAFDATSFAATFDVTFFPASCGFLWTRDFEMDAAPNVGQLIVAQLGDQFKYQMDNWIAVGDGTTQPQGLNNAGLGSVSASGTSHQTMVYNDGLNMAFGITKPFRKAFGGDSTMFVMTDKMYKKFMQLTTGVTGDTRPIYGMHVKDYQLGDYHVAVQNDIADGTVFFANLRGYRLYRRLGLYFELITTGQTLTLANEKLLFARARFGGKITLTGYGAKMTSLQIG